MDTQAKVAKELGSIESRLPWFHENISNMACIANQLENLISRIACPEPSAGAPLCDKVEPQYIVDKLDDITSTTRETTERIGRAVDKLSTLI